MLTMPNYNLSNYRIKVPGQEYISEGFSYAGVDEYGAMQAAPDKNTIHNLTSFSNTLADPTIISSNPGAVKYLNDEYYSTLNAMGISGDPSKGDNFRPIGVDESGKQMYSTQNMITSADYQLGSKIVKSAVDILSGFGNALGRPTFNTDELSKFKSIADISKDPAILSQLNAARQSNDKEGFIDIITGLFKPDSPKVTASAVSKMQVAAAQNANQTPATAVTNTVGQTPAVPGTEDKNKLMDTLGTAYNAYAMYQMWDYLGPAQKASGLAIVGIKGWELATGEKLGNKVLVDATLHADGSQLTPALTVGDALGLFNMGINAYGLAKNWDQMSDVARVAGVSNTVNGIATIAKSFNLLGSGTTNAAVAGVSSGSLAAAGYSSVPHLGVGAIVGPASAGVPAGYTVVASMPGNNVALVPTANAPTAQGASSSAGSTLGTAVGLASTGLAAFGLATNWDNMSDAERAFGAATVARSGASLMESGSGAGTAGSVAGSALGVAGIAYGAYQIYQGWGTGGEKGAVNGAIGGASMAAGLYALGATNPFLLAGVVAVGALSGMIKTGKHKDRVARDSVRKHFRDIGLADHDWNITLADGTKFNIGLDEQDGRHDFLDPQKAASLGADISHRLHAYDVDYTNDVAYAASLGSVALSRILTGGANTGSDQLGGQLANAFISNVDYQDGNLTEEKFEKIMTNQRAAYSKVGIKTKASAYALANQMYAEGRINDIQLVQMHQSFNMMYNKESWKYAQTLFAGRWNGVAAANEKKDIRDPNEGGDNKKEEEEEVAVAAAA